MGGPSHNAVVRDGDDGPGSRSAPAATWAGQDNVSKLLWANWHRDLGELAMDVAGKAGLVAEDGEFDVWQHLYLFTRADTIYGGSNEIQRNIIAERVLGLPREVKG